MEKRSIGQFIAALRKASGMTQQEVADRLNVSNKAVSRWERDECAPDLTLIPALAELYGVTCDEILKGERILNPATKEKSELKVEKQIKILINRAMTGFQTLIWISLALAVIGLICMFGISYGFYRPVIGFAVMLLLEVAAVVVSAIAVGKMQNVKTENELFEMAEKRLSEKFDRCLGNFSFYAFFAVLSSVLLSLPLLGASLFTDPYSVLTFGSYFINFIPIILLILIFIYLKTKELYASRITARPRKAERNREVRLMNFLQIGTTVLACIFFLSTPYFDSPFSGITAITGFLFLAANGICFFVFMLRLKNDRSKLTLPGIRNMLLTLSAVLFAMACTGVSYSTLGGTFDRTVSWDPRYFTFGICWALLVSVIFDGIRFIQKQTPQSDEHSA